MFDFGPRLELDGSYKISMQQQVYMLLTPNGFAKYLTFYKTTKKCQNHNVKVHLMDLKQFLYNTSTYGT